MKRKLKWTVVFSVDPDWVADGFDLDDFRALTMLANDLSSAHIELELDAKVIKAPSAKLIRKLQGYND